FQGKPVNILPLTKSKNASELQNNNIEIKLFLMNGPDINVDKPKNKPKNKGRKIIAIGIKNLKVSSKVRE
ncbi:hypothetical protein N9S62_03940, partial [Pelagibacteraceae bacterium]|nr:hypothetical protein [Pelagibacteraceae bacterium]